ncbi:UNKNOWN [Stylonychia lemnae]|uniref:Uncharacterized protein n=1 Tax=Stylonychia lemnae TaxID=5949 RepID=A0A078A903_STYLE|nr:UNKNOWN [Stylonychia lemnae]|eukprot:CDW78032.1 UNKNOWN [Stylonychia lemnae]
MQEINEKEKQRQRILEGISLMPFKNTYQAGRGHARNYSSDNFKESPIRTQSQILIAQRYPFLMEKKICQQISLNNSFMASSEFDYKSKQLDLDRMVVYKKENSYPKFKADQMMKKFDNNYEYLAENIRINGNFLKIINYDKIRDNSEIRLKSKSLFSKNKIKIKSLLASPKKKYLQVVNSQIKCDKNQSVTEAIVEEESSRKGDYSDYGEINIGSFGNIQPNIAKTSNTNSRIKTKKTQVLQTQDIHNQRNSQTSHDIKVQNKKDKFTKVQYGSFGNLEILHDSEISQTENTNIQPSFDSANLDKQNQTHYAFENERKIVFEESTNMITIHDQKNSKQKDEDKQISKSLQDNSIFIDNRIHQQQASYQQSDQTKVNVKMENKIFLKTSQTNQDDQLKSSIQTLISDEKHQINFLNDQYQARSEIKDEIDDQLNQTITENYGEITAAENDIIIDQYQYRD